MAVKRLSIGVLSSHEGTNLQTIIDACKEGRLHASVAMVVCNNSRAMALERAKREGIPFRHISARTHPEPREQDAAIASAFPLHTSRPIIDGFFELVHTRNTGAAFSLFADSGPLVKGIILPLVSGLAIVLVLVLFWQSESSLRRVRYGLTLILAGAVGNLYDRFVHGYVVDFLDVFVGSYHWPAFNVADSCITVGAGLLVLDAFLTRGQDARPAELD